MNGYDFDKTILKGNSVNRFARFCFLRFPYLLLLIPELLLALLLHCLRIIKKESFLRMMELFLMFVPNKQKFAKRFWDKNLKHIKGWYLKARQDDDIVISASPTFLIEEACSRLGVRCIASRCGKHGNVVGPHCYGEQKVVRYREVFGDAPLETYYSDSLSDMPMFKLAKRGYLVKGENITLVCENGVEVK